MAEIIFQRRAAIHVVALFFAVIHIIETSTIQLLEAVQVGELFFNVAQVNDSTTRSRSTRQITFRRLRPVQREL